TAHPDDPIEIAFHVIDSLMPAVLTSHDAPMLADRFAANRNVLDIGSGAGFPGLIRAAATPAHVTLVESRRKRASFLQVAVAEMTLTNASVDPRRADPLQLAPRFDLVTTRALSIGDFFPIAGAALKSGGIAMLYINPS